MINYLSQLDRHLFYLINHGMSNGFFDWLMPIMRNPVVWIPLYACLIGFCLYRYKKTGAYIIVLLALAVGTCDFSGNIIKHAVKRLRPCNNPALAQTIINRVPCGSGFSFISSHASNHFTIAIFLSAVFYKRKKWLWIPAVLWAGAISFAQVYVGLHYPIDVTAGALFGMIMGLMFALLFKKLQPQF